MELLFKYLEERNPALAKIARDIEAANAALWDPPQAPWFTDHGPRHSRRIGGVIEQILFGVPGFLNRAPLGPEEMLVLIGACFLHDAGMQMTRELSPLEQPEEIASGNVLVGRAYETFVRPDHPYTIYQIIMDPAPGEHPLGRLGLHRCPRHLQQAIAEVSLSHGRWGYLSYLLKRFDPSVRLDLLGALLQIGDVLDVSRERINPELLAWIHLPLVSQSHWLMSRLVSSLFIDSRAKIRVTYEVPGDVYHDAILAHFIRRAVEKDWIEGFAGEAIDHLERFYRLRLQLEPRLNVKDFSGANEVMIERSPHEGEPCMDMDVLQAYRGRAGMSDSQEQARVQRGDLPESCELQAVIWALAAHGVFEQTHGATPPIQDTDIGVAGRCGILRPVVWRACERLRNWGVLIESEDRNAVAGFGRDVGVHRYTLKTCRKRPGEERKTAGYWYEKMRKGRDKK